MQWINRQMSTPHEWFFWLSARGRALGIAAMLWPGLSAAQTIYESSAQIESGWYHSCAVNKSGGVECWGSNANGALGNGDRQTLESFSPVAVVGLNESMVSVSAGYAFTCARGKTGKLYCWGGNTHGQLGVGTSGTVELRPLMVSALADRARDVSAGARHACAVGSKGGVYCWGDNALGQLGNGVAGAGTTLPSRVMGAPSGVTRVYAGDGHNCVIASSGTVWCWGDNSRGQLGDGTRVAKYVPTQVPGLTGVVAMSTLYQHTCAVTNAYKVYCWGANYHGALGAPGGPSPVAVTGLPAKVKQVTVGWLHSCAMTSSETYCWGENNWGAVGVENPNPAFSAIKVPGLPTNMVALSAGVLFTCARHSTGRVYCWGYNFEGQLGDNLDWRRPTPYRIAAFDSLAPDPGYLGRVKQIDLGHTHSCAVTDAGAAYCWGHNLSAQLGDGTQVKRRTPVPVTGLSSGVQSIAAGFSHTCALLAGGEVRCWGSNYYGQLGLGSSGQWEPVAMPTTVPGLDSGVVALDAEGHSTCAVMQSGALKCWGDNVFGGLGDGTQTNRSRPTQVVGMDANVESVALGAFTTCAVRSDTGAYCWGQNTAGEVGDGTTTHRLTPVPLSGWQSGANFMATNHDHSCGVTRGGAAMCWGANTHGQLGTGTNTWHLTPAGVYGLGSGMKMVGEMQYSTCGLRTSGDVFCWGLNMFAELGVGYSSKTWPIYMLTPQPVIGLQSGIVAISTGERTTCALDATGSVVCWGSNFYGQVGDGTSGYRHTPAPVRWNH